MATASDAISDDYLAKARFALRRTAGSELVDADIKDLIRQCRADLIRIGVPETTVKLEDDTQEASLVLGCLRCFVRWQFGIDGDNAERNHEDYLELADNLRKSVKTTEGS